MFEFVFEFVFVFVFELKIVLCCWQLYLNESEISIAKCNLKNLMLKFTDIANLFFFKRELSRIIREFTKIIISFYLRQLYVFFKRELSRLRSWWAPM